MWFGILTLATALIISISAAYYSILGLTAIFAAAFWPIVILGSSLEVGKIISTLWLHKYWERAEVQYKVYLCSAVAILMLLTSMGVFGFLSKAHSDQSLVSGDVIAKISIYDEKIKQARDNIDMARKALVQMDAAVDQTMSRSSTEQGADKAAQLRRSQGAERNRLLKEIDTEQKKIQAINQERAPIAAEVRKVEAEVGPIKYIAALIYGDNPEDNLLDKAVRWVIILIVIVFDPLALTLLLAATKSIEWERGINIMGSKRKEPDYESDDGPLTDDQLQQLKETSKADLPNGKVISKDSLFSESKEFFDRARTTAHAIDNGTYKPPKDQQTHIPIDDYYHDSDKKKEDVGDWNDFFNGHKTFQEVNEQVQRPTLEPDPLPTVNKDISQPGWMFGDYNTDVKSEQTSVEQKKLNNLELSDNLHVAQAKAVYKMSHPDEDLTLTEKAFNAGKITELPWGTTDHIEGLNLSDGEKKALRKTLALQSDNEIMPAGIVTGFGINFPSSPKKGDLFLRVDRLPTELFKFNGQQWIVVDKTTTDSYAYDEKYIDLLIDKIAAGEYDVDMLSDTEQQQLQKRLSEKG
jgi:hypothetical protein